MAEEPLTGLCTEIDRLNSKVDELHHRLDEAEQALEAIRTGQVESLVLQGPNGARIFSLEGADHSYRVLVEAMSEGAATISEDGTILYCNACFARMLDTHLERAMGSEMLRYLPDASRDSFAALVREARGGDSRAEIELLSQSGEIVPAYISLSVIRDDDTCRFCMIATDLRGRGVISRLWHPKG